MILLDARTLLNAVLLDVTSILLGVTLTIHYATSFLLDVTSGSSIPDRFFSMPVRFHWTPLSMPLRSSQLLYLSNAPLLKPMTEINIRFTARIVFKEIFNPRDCIAAPR